MKDYIMDKAREVPKPSPWVKLDGSAPVPYKRRKKAVELIPCDNCGKMVEKPRRDALRNVHNFCSRACGYDFKRVAYSAKCEWCGEDFTYRKGQGRYCSRECDQSYRAAHPESFNRRGREAVATCANCKKEFPISPSRLARAARNYCSNACRGEYTRLLHKAHIVLASKIDAIIARARSGQ
jgi:hypothetical protein